MWPWSGVMSSAEDSSRPDEDSDKARLLELVFAQLMHEVQHGAPGARLSARLRTALERMSPAERRAVVSRAVDGCAPLFVAARRGNAEVAEYLVHVCGAPLEQCGAYCTPAERATHRVTPLWAAAVGGRLAALRVLADAGAELDARSDSGSTPLRSACFMTHLAAVRFLCERGADVHATNHNGGTCLINGVQCARLTAYLLARGASVDARDAHGKTALHYAIQEHRADTARVLLAAGASPHVRSAAGDDALRTACVRGAHQVVELLCASVRYSPEQIADAHELLGATQLDEFNDAAAALGSWRRATAIRYTRQRRALRRGADPQAAGSGRVRGAGRRARVDLPGGAGGAGRGCGGRARAGRAGGRARARGTPQGHRVPAHVPGRVVRGRGPAAALRGAVDVGAPDTHRYRHAAAHRHVPHGVRTHQAAGGPVPRGRAGGRGWSAARGGAARAAAGRARRARESSVGVGASVVRGAGGGVGPHAALPRAPRRPRGPRRRLVARARPPRGRDEDSGVLRAEHALGARVAAAPGVLAADERALRLLRGGGAPPRAVPLGPRRAPAAGRGGCGGRAGRARPHRAARRRRLLQLQRRTSGGAGGGRRARVLAGCARRRAARPAAGRAARLAAAARDAGVPGGARAAAAPGARAARPPPAAHAARLPRPAPLLSALSCVGECQPVCRTIRLQARPNDGQHTQRSVSGTGLERTGSTCKIKYTICEALH